MLKPLSLATSVIALSTALALGQTTAPPTGGSESATVPGTTSASGRTGTFITQQTPDQFRMSKLWGENVYGQNNEKVGDVRDILIDRNGKALAVVVGVGGFLGIGEKNVAIPFQDVKVTERNGEHQLTIGATRDQLKAAPEFRIADTTPATAATGTAATTAGPGGHPAGTPTRTALGSTDLQAIRSAKVSLTQALDTAERQGQGKAIETEFDSKLGGGGQYEVKVLAQDGKIVKYKIDATSGQIVGTENEIFERYFTRLKPADLQNAPTSLKQALAIAEQRVGGKAVDGDVEREGNSLRYEVTVATGDRTQRVRIDGNGQVVAND